jgi:hypothetical protein
MKKTTSINIPTLIKIKPKSPKQKPKGSVTIKYHKNHQNTTPHADQEEESIMHSNKRHPQQLLITSAPTNHKKPSPPS